MEFLEVKEVMGATPMSKRIKLSISEVLKIQNFVKQLIDIKITEPHHKVDKGNEFKRWVTGISGEVALEKFLGVNFVDWTVGDSSNYHKSDLSTLGLNVGVKTVEIGKYPIIFKANYYPQILVVRASDTDFYIIGLASVKVMNTFQNEELILSKALKNRGTKTAFTGFHLLKKFKTLGELKNLLK